MKDTKKDPGSSAEDRPISFAERDPVLTNYCPKDLPKIPDTIPDNHNPGRRITMSSEAAYRELRRKTTASIRLDGIGSSHGHDDEDTNTRNFESLTYVDDESDVSRAHLAAEHYRHRGQFWNDGKHQTMIRYVMIIVIGLVQATVAYLTNVTTNYFVTNKFDRVNELIEAGSTVTAFFVFMSIQLAFASLAALFVWIEPVSAGSGIPEVKCYLNGIDLPRVGAPRTLLCKVLGVTCSVAAGLPVGKEGPMVHSGAVVATTVSSGQTRNDREKRDLVACGAAAGVCTAFSAPIGGILFALEEGASYWGPSNTWRTFFCSMVALMFLYVLNEIGSGFGKVGFNRLFSFGNFIFEGYQSSFSVYELFPFIMIGFFGGAIGAIFNNTNERITHWRIKNVNYSKKRRFIEVLCVSSAVSVVTFALPWVWGHCTKIPDTIDFTADQLTLLEELVSFGCPEGHYNEIASLIFTEASVAIRQLFHLHHHAFRDSALIMFFFSYISMAVVVYGIAVPSGLFVPSLLSGAAFGRLFGNISLRLFPELAYSNTYALVGAAAVLGGMARMTISLTVILLECTGNEQYVLPLMLTLMTARITGGLFNDDLYHIHIHMKKGVQFLEAELRSVTRHHKYVHRKATLLTGSLSHSALSQLKRTADHE